MSEDHTPTRSRGPLLDPPESGCRGATEAASEPLLAVERAPDDGTPTELVFENEDGRIEIKGNPRFVVSVFRALIQGEKVRGELSMSDEIFKVLAADMELTRREFAKVGIKI